MAKINRTAVRRESAALDVNMVDDADAIPSKTREALLAIDGVEGVGLSGTRQLCVYIRDMEVRQNLPKKIDGFWVSCRCTGTVRFQ